MTWFVWTAIVVLLGTLLTVSWWYDRDARRRGATPLSSGDMVSGARGRRWDTARRVSQLVQGGATPRGQDAHAESWRRPGPRP